MWKNTSSTPPVVVDLPSDPPDQENSEIEHRPTFDTEGNQSGIKPSMQLHHLLFITRKYNIINANLKLINAKMHSF